MEQWKEARNADKIIAQEAVGFEGGFGPKGHQSLAQALAWVVLFY
jgi:hypothetical protein